MQNNGGEGSDGALNKLPLVFDLEEREEEIVNHFTSLVSNVCLTHNGFKHVPTRCIKQSF